jgi:hypothetical protein
MTQDEYPRIYTDAIATSAFNLISVVPWFFVAILGSTLLYSFSLDKHHTIPASFGYAISALPVCGFVAWAILREAAKVGRLEFWPDKIVLKRGDSTSEWLRDKISKVEVMSSRENQGPAGKTGVAIRQKGAVDVGHRQPDFFPADFGISVDYVKGWLSPAN